MGPGRGLVLEAPGFGHKSCSCRALRRRRAPQVEASTRPRGVEALRTPFPSRNGTLILRGLGGWGLAPCRESGGSGCLSLRHCERGSSPSQVRVTRSGFCAILDHPAAPLRPHASRLSRLPLLAPTVRPLRVDWIDPYGSPARGHFFNRFADSIDRPRGAPDAPDARAALTAARRRPDSTPANRPRRPLRQHSDFPS